MNPIWRVAHEMSKSRSETQRKNQKRREAARQVRKQEKEKYRMEAIERDRTRYLIGQEKELTSDQNISGANRETVEETAEEKFQRELDWCKEQLERGLASQKPGSDSRQARDAEKALKTLRSSKAPMVKKRQVMHATFGDYRKKMKEEEKRSQKSAMSKSKMTTASSNQQKCSSTYYKKSARNQTQESTMETTNPNNLTTENSDSSSSSGNQSGPVPTTTGGANEDTHFTVSLPADEEPFKFNFEIPNEPQDSHSSSDSELDIACNATQNLNIGDSSEQFTFGFNVETEST